jgi:hypothetical protein
LMPYRNLRPLRSSTLLASRFGIIMKCLFCYERYLHLRHRKSNFDLMYQSTTQTSASDTRGITSYISGCKLTPIQEMWYEALYPALCPLKNIDHRKSAELRESPCRSGLDHRPAEPDEQAWTLAVLPSHTQQVRCRQPCAVPPERTVSQARTSLYCQLVCAVNWEPLFA